MVSNEPNRNRKLFGANGYYLTHTSILTVNSQNLAALAANLSKAIKLIASLYVLLQR